MVLRSAVLNTNIAITASRNPANEWLPWLCGHLRQWETDMASASIITLASDHNTATSIANNYTGFTLYTHRREKALGQDPISGNYGVHYWLDSNYNAARWYLFRDHTPGSGSNNYGSFGVVNVNVQQSGIFSLGSAPIPTYTVIYNNDVGNSYFHFGNSYSSGFTIAEIIYPAGSPQNDYPPIAEGFGWAWFYGGYCIPIGRDHSDGRLWSPDNGGSNQARFIPSSAGFSTGNIPIRGRNSVMGFQPPGVRCYQPSGPIAPGNVARIDGVNYTAFSEYQLIQSSLT